MTPGDDTNSTGTEPDEQGSAVKKPGGATPAGKDQRAARLAAALRQNLTRRKAQARGRKAEAGASGQSQPPRGET